MLPVNAQRKSRAMKVFGLLLPMFLLSGVIAQSRVSPTPPKLILHEGWTIQSSAKVTAAGEAISTPAFSTVDWIPAEVPTTVAAAQVKQGLLPDPFFGMNLRKLPGMNYPIGGFFSNMPMQPDSPYAVAWWYRKEFSLPPDYAAKTVWLNFRGINYRANVFLNGKKIADSRDVAGAWRTYEFNVTGAVTPGTNVLALQVWAPTEDSLAITFVDWNPLPPDKDMGVFREVYLTASGPVAVRHPAVISKVDSPANDAAHLTVTALVKNASDRPVTGTLQGRIGNIEFSQPVDLAANESKNVTFSPDQYPQLNLTKPRLWWPAQMGSPDLYDLDLTFEIDSTASDWSRTKFGIREITSEVIENAPNRLKRLFKINGKNILIRGGGWTPDMMLRQDAQRMADEFRYVKDMGLNTVRLEGKLESDAFFETADQQGILVMAGWCCCDFWERWEKWKEEQGEVAKASLRDQIYRLRSHPSLLTWLNGSDNPPPPEVEEMYLQVEKDLLWSNPILSSATAKPTTVTGESGVKMTGPYDYVAPSFWMTDSHRPAAEQLCSEGGCGGAYGFNTETSMGPAVPTIESVRRMVPKDHLWPLDEYWNFHAGGGDFKSIQTFADALNARYGKAASAEDFTFKSQLMTYEGVRAMYEAYSRNKYISTGVIQWMLNNAWPSMIWHLYDYYLQPGGGYFGAKKALQKLNPIYGYDDRSIWLVSSQYADVKELKLTARVFNLDATEKFSQEIRVDSAAADSTTRLLQLPQIEGLSPVYFLDLRVMDSAGALVSSNFYWLTTNTETLDWAKSSWHNTPTQSYADYTSLAQLPKVRLTVSSRTEREGEQSVTRINLQNPTKSIAFFVRLKVNNSKGGEEILPVLWEDNYISLLPGEKREIAATYRTDLSTSKPDVEVHGWNVE